MTVLRAELLEGRAIALAGPAPDGLARALLALGARVEILEVRSHDDEDAVGAWARQHEPLHAVVYDAGPSFGNGGPEALTGTLQAAWLAVREVAVGALIQGADPGKIVLLAPRPDAGPYAQAAAAALESLARTLSVEWARYGVTSVVVVSAAGAEEPRLTELVAFLCSPAGEYLSGCRLELDQVLGV